MNKDTVYAHPRNVVEDFRFDAAVADVFENMINRSVPGYGLVLELMGLIAEKYAQPGTNCYDLGCSLGASTLTIRRHVPASCRVIGVDNSAAMVERCRANMARDRSAAPVEIIRQDLRDTVIANASLVAMNFTLQFVPPRQRDGVLAGIARGMLSRGVMILSEKIAFGPDDECREFMTDLHHEFKRFQGYSDLEIAQKRTALEHVLLPETEARHKARLRGAGFSEVYTVVRCINFASFVAIR